MALISIRGLDFSIGEPLLLEHAFPSDGCPGSSLVRYVAAEYRGQLPDRARVPLGLRHGAFGVAELRVDLHFDLETVVEKGIEQKRLDRNPTVHPAIEHLPGGAAGVDDLRERIGIVGRDDIRIDENGAGERWLTALGMRLMGTHQADCDQTRKSTRPTRENADFSGSNKVELIVPLGHGQNTRRYVVLSFF